MKNSIKQNLFRSLIRLSQSPISRIYRIFPWVITWHISSMCNLRCVYCTVPREDTHPDFKRALRKIIKLKPKLLVISGGEPLLVPNLEAIVQKIKREVDPYIIVNTNATLPRRVVPLLPYVDEFAISIDGLGEVNKRARGIDGDKIIECIQSTLDEIKAQGLETSITALCLVTNDNYTLIPSLVHRLHELSPHIRTNLLPMQPYTHPLSIASNPANYSEFVKIVTNLSNQGFRIRVTGPFCEKGAMKEVACYRQYFRGAVDKDGVFIPCKPYAYAAYFLHELGRAISERNPLMFMQILKQMIDSLILHRYDPVCPFPCNCDDYVDSILLCESVELLWREPRNLLSRLNLGEMKETYDFIAKHINPKFNPDLLNSNKLKGKESFTFIALPPIFCAQAPTVKNKMSIKKKDSNNEYK